ncbi:uncharacterized protein LOC121001502 [Bufo bufo]|uniref:uncharacterized protein LOC121001502 n=1 Tax=Bufo bufo TaxID=8384 RepID=UPI001ABEA34B|nr:uncharacterized protein LOC121001502 [Bufo bufo]
MSFAYSEERAREIVSEVTTSTEFLKTPPAELRGKDWEKESRKLVAWELHAATLAEYCRHQRIPRGLRVNLRPTFFCDDLQYCTQFANILNKCSHDLMILTIEHLNTSIAETKIHISSIEQQLQDSLTAEDLISLKQKIDKNCSDLKKDIEATKRKKYTRDLEDYQNKRIYKWQDSLGTAIPLTRRFTRRTGSQSSGSGSDYSTGVRPQAPFLGQSRRRGRIQGEQDGTTGETQASMTTRSQSQRK